MIKTKHIPDTNIVELTIDGEITAREFDETLDVLSKIIEEYGKIRLLKQIGKMGIPPIPFSRFCDDITFNFQHLSDITHVAVVADQNWVNMFSKLFDPLFKAELKSFKLSELEQARDWIKTAS